MSTVDKIKELCQTWYNYQKDIRQFTKGPHAYEIPYFVQQLREMSLFLHENIPIICIWVSEYLQANKSTIFVKFWRDHVHQYAKGHAVLHPRAKEWDEVFNEPDIRLTTAIAAVNKIRSMRDITHCDDITILAIHEGKEHNGDFMCDYCDTQDYYWRLELERRLKHSVHPLLNPDRSMYVKPAISDWRPPYIFNDINHKTYYELEECFEELCQIRARERVKMGRTVREHMEHFLGNHFSQWCINSWRYERIKTDYDLFIILWNVLPIVLHAVSIDLPWINKIEKFNAPDKHTSRMQDRFVKEGEQLFNTMCANLEEVFKMEHVDIFDITNLQDWNSSKLKETDAHLIMPLLKPWIIEEMKGIIDQILWKPFRCNYNDMYYAYKKLFRYKNYYLQLILDTDDQLRYDCDFLVKETEDELKYTTKYAADMKCNTKCIQCGNIHNIHFSLMLRGWRDDKLHPGTKWMEDDKMEDYYWSTF